jgi:hypothetical protein
MIFMIIIPIFIIIILSLLIIIIGWGGGGLECIRMGHAIHYVVGTFALLEAVITVHDPTNEPGLTTASGVTDLCSSGP